MWITTGTGANYPFFSFIGDILEEIIERHLQFQDEVDDEAREAVEAAARQRNVDIETSLHLMVGVHVRRTDFHYYSKNWMADLLNETFYQEAMRYMRTKFQAVTFLVVSDDQEWCRHHLQARYIQAILYLFQCGQLSLAEAQRGSALIGRELRSVAPPVSLMP